mgnify:CR=1 FL=1
MKDKILKAKEVILNGGVILYPTDTIWGIGCSAIIESAIKKIFRIKRRDNSKLLISLVSSIKMLERYVKNVPEYALEYLYDDSPTTIIYPKVKGLNHILYGKNESIAIRLVKDNFCKALIDEINIPLILLTLEMNKRAPRSLIQANIKESKRTIQTPYSH